MICVEGHKAFRGTMRILPKGVPPYKAINESFTLTGDWLYKPQYNCWYCKGSSYPACVCEVVEDETA